MKDLIFCVFVISTLSFTATVNSNSLYIPPRTGIVLEYLTNNHQNNKKIYSYQSIDKIESHDSVTQVYYHLSLKNKKHIPLAPSINLTAYLRESGVQLYEWDPTLLSGDGEVELSGDGICIPSSLKIGQQLKDGFMVISQNNLKTRINIIQRKVTDYKQITVPAGKYPCYKIEEIHETTTFGQQKRTCVHTWYCPNIGIIASESYDLKGKKQSQQNLIAVRESLRLNSNV